MIQAYRLARQLLFLLKAVALAAQTSAMQRSWAEVAAATQMAVAVEEVLLGIAALAEQVVAISLVVEMLGPAGLGAVVVAEEEERVTLVDTLAVAPVAALGCSAVDQTEVAVLVPFKIRQSHLAAEAGLVVHLAHRATMVESQVAHMAAGLEAPALTILPPTAASVPSALSGALVAPIRRTPQTSN